MAIDHASRREDRIDVSLLRKWIFFFSWLTFFSVLPPLLQAQNQTQERVVEASASVQDSPPQIALTWPVDPEASIVWVERKAFSNTTWGAKITLPGSASGYIDTQVEVGKTYEYRITKQTADYLAYGYVYSGIRAPLTESRGKLILIVESTYAGDLANELALLEEDLIGDGWEVVRHDVSRNDSVQSVKAVITSIYQQDPDRTKALFLFGNIPVPYSGDIVPDGHPNHQGAWPADSYYGDMDGFWTDTSVISTNAERTENWNVPGDGKFDQSLIPSPLELQVGRVDLSNLTSFSNKTPSRSERDLLRQYLNKDHNFRHRRFTVERRGLVTDHFGLRGSDDVAGNGWRNFASFFGAQNVFEGVVSNYVATTSVQSYLWSYGAGGGSYYYSAGVASSDDFALSDIKVVFGMFLGSYYGDWNNESNLLRAFLGSTSYTLVSIYCGSPDWFCHHMALGETIGYSTRLTQNNRVRSTYTPYTQGINQVHIALMGDPTLRLHPVIPASNLTGTVNGAGVTLSWNPSADTELQGYHIYRSASPSGPFTRIDGDVPFSGVTFTDPSPFTDGTYMVRAIKLEQSGSGTYFNASQGIFTTVRGASVQKLSLSGQRDGNGNVSFQVRGAAGERFVLEATADFQHWEPLATNTLSGDGFQFSDQLSGASARRFFRCRALP